jgi:hypothetical protein
VPLSLRIYSGNDDYHVPGRLLRAPADVVTHGIAGERLELDARPVMSSQEWKCRITTNSLAGTEEAKAEWMGMKTGRKERWGIRLSQSRRPAEEVITTEGERLPRAVLDAPPREEPRSSISRGDESLTEKLHLPSADLFRSAANGNQVAAGSRWMGEEHMDAIDAKGQHRPCDPCHDC